MGKGDKKTRRGKIIKGSYGVLRRKKKTGIAKTEGIPVKIKEKASQAKKEAVKEVTQTVEEVKDARVQAAKPAEAKKSGTESPAAEKPKKPSAKKAGEKEVKTTDQKDKETKAE
jgi:ribosomal small subunit protein bTHX